MSNENRIHWVIDDFMEDRVLPSGMPSISAAAIEAGHTVWRTAYDSDNPDVTPQGEMLPDDGRPVICLAAIPVVARLMRDHPDWLPGAFPHDENFACSTWARHAGDLMLNDEFEIITWKKFKESQRSNPREVFLRPDFGHKLFPGLLLRPGKLPDPWSVEKPFHRVKDDDMVFTAPPRKILGESRFLIVDGSVVTGSTYRWADKLDIRIDVPEVSRQLAAEVASREWQAAPAYICDVAVVEGEDGSWEARLIELNPFSSAGLYAGDTRIMVREVSRLAIAISQELSLAPGPSGR